MGRRTTISSTRKPAVSPDAVRTNLEPAELSTAPRSAPTSRNSPTALRTTVRSRKNREKVKRASDSSPGAERVSPVRPRRQRRASLSQQAFPDAKFRNSTPPPEEMEASEKWDEGVVDPIEKEGIVDIEHHSVDADEEEDHDDETDFLDESPCPPLDNTTTNNNTNNEYAPLLEATLVTTQTDMPETVYLAQAAEEQDGKCIPKSARGTQLCIRLAIVIGFVIMAVAITGIVCASGICSARDTGSETEQTIPSAAPSPPYIFVSTAPSVAPKNIFDHNNTIDPTSSSTASMEVPTTLPTTPPATESNTTDAPISPPTPESNATVAPADGPSGNATATDAPTSTPTKQQSNTTAAPSNSPSENATSEESISCLADSGMMVVEQTSCILLFERQIFMEITSLNLSRAELRGDLPSQLGLLSRLASLDLRQNSLKGTLPSQLALLTQLTHLMLVRNDLSGPFPGYLAEALTSLTNLDFSSSGTRLTGTIPSQIGLMTNLTVVGLGKNELEGTIPSQIGFLTAVTGLQLLRNQLEGPIPSEIGLMRQLKVFSARDGTNKLTGALPTELTLLTLLEVLNLRGHHMTGNLPSQLGSLLALTELELGAQENAAGFNGSIPSEIGFLVNLVNLGLENNEISGTIPTTLGLFSSLKTLDLSNTQIFGSVPEELCNLQNFVLKSFEFDRQRVTGCGV